MSVRVIALCILLVTSQSACRDANASRQTRRPHAAGVRFDVSAVQSRVRFSRYATIDGSLRFTGTLTNESEARVSITRTSAGTVSVHKMVCDGKEIAPRWGPVFFDESPLVGERAAEVELGPGQSASLFEFTPTTVAIGADGNFVQSSVSVSRPALCRVVFQYFYWRVASSPPVTSNPVDFELMP
jgi:hypothetical protein